MNNYSNIPVTLEKTGTEEYILNMGPQHPSTHGVLRLVLKLDGETIKDIVPDLGYVHRGLEKLFENRTYGQIIPYLDRTDYLSAMNNEWAYVMAVEKLMGIEAPERAQYMRVIFAELNRIMSHLLWYSAYGMDIGALTPLLYAFREREEIIDMVEAACGGRLTHNYYRIGGFRQDLPKGFFDMLKKFISHFKDKVDEYEALLINNVIFVKRAQGVGVLTKDTAINYGVTGPNLRAAGVNIDIRKQDAYGVYGKLDFKACLRDNGDTWDRCKARMAEMRECVTILKQAMDMIPEGDVMAKVPKIIKPAAGEVYTRVEGPKGEVGVYIVSDGTDKPYRMKLRQPSFSNLSVIKEISVGHKIADLVAIMGSLDIIIPEIDR